MKTQDEITRRFNMFGTRRQRELRATLQENFNSVALTLLALPDGREKAKALNRLEEAMMWARESLDH